MGKTLGYDAPQLVAQQKGLNNIGQDGFEKYARVMLETTIGGPGDYQRLTTDLPTMTQAESEELGKTFKDQLIEGFAATGTKLIEFYPVKFEKVSGMTCLHISFKRQAPDKPAVLVHSFSFHNFDRKHVLTLSYRLTESDYWARDYAAILKSFRISNIK